MEGMQSFEVLPGVPMRYGFFPPANFDSKAPTTFLISIAGRGHEHVNHFSRSLACNDWALAVPTRPASAPCFFEAKHERGDGKADGWTYLEHFCHHLLKTYNVAEGKFLFAGVSNGGGAILVFGARYPQLVRGLLALCPCVPGTVQPTEMLQRLQGIAIDMHCGTADPFYPSVYSFYDTMNNQLHHRPQVQATAYEGAGHMISPLVDHDTVVSKLQLMELHSSADGGEMHIKDERSSAIKQTSRFAQELGLELTSMADGITVRKKSHFMAPMEGITGSLRIISASIRESDEEQMNLEELFAKSDETRNGSLDFEELSNFMKDPSCPKNLSQLDPNDVFAELDANFDGKVDLDELKSFLMPNATPALNLGAPVKYLSTTLKAWVETRIIAKHINGSIMIECKPEYWIETVQQPSLIRRVAGGKSIVTRGLLEGFGLGDRCQYYGTSHSDYVAAQIIAVRDGGDVFLNVKEAWIPAAEAAQKLKQ